MALADPSISRDDLEKLEPILLRFALRATRDRELSRDLTQDALLAAFSQAREFSGRSSLRTWVVGILSHKILDHFRRARVREGEGAEDVELLSTPSHESVERALMAKQELRLVERALAELPERERLALLLVDVEGVDRDECCRVLEVQATHLRVLLHRGRNRLRKALENDS